jgi:predicted nucleic acid-binding protein
VSPLPSRIVVDNTVIPTLYVADALSQVLGLWPGQWIVPLQVRREAAAWRAHGAAVTKALDRLESAGVIAYDSPGPGSEGALFARLQRTRGEGESAAIAIAHVRGFAVATDDQRARNSCRSLAPPVLAIATEELLDIAIADALLTESEALVMWTATGIRDPNRGIGRARP